MKKLFIAFAAIATLSQLIPSSSFAEPTHPNEVGLYMTPDGYGATGTTVVSVPVTVYLVLTKPTEVNNGEAPYHSVNAFEVALRFEPVPGFSLFLLSAALPPQSVDVGLRKDINEGYLDYSVGIWPTPLPVVDEAAVLVTFSFLKNSIQSFNVYLEPVEDPYIPGQMLFQSIEGNLEIMHSVGGSHEAPVFIFGGEAVAVENESFGSVKALYR